MASRALLITGATGKQGGAVVNALLKSNTPFEILAVTRNAQSASAQKLLRKSPNVKLVTGDFNAIDDIFRQAKAATSIPIWGVFSVQVRTVQVWVVLHVIDRFIGSTWQQ
jgi:nucleoside-diphosphate-sugar epimerase